MKGNLAVITPQLGTVSETFVRRHVEDICPGQTVAVARASSHPLGGRWKATVPVLFLDEWERGLAVRTAVRLGANSQRLLLGRMERFLRKHDVRWVVGEYLDRTLEFVPLFDRLGIPYVVQGHGIDLSASLRSEETQASYRRFSSARAILTRCEFHRKRLIGLGLPEDKVHVNPGGIDLPAKKLDRKPGWEKRILALGRMTAKKGPVFLLEAFRQAAEADPALTLTYVGGGEWAGAVRQFVQACGLQGRVRLPGMVSEEEKEELLQTCGIFVQHSVTDPDTGDEEGLPAAIQEAMAHEMAVVTTWHSGIPELVEHGRCGLLVEEGDVSGMADAVVELARDPDRVEGMGRHNRSVIEAGHTWEQERRRLIGHLGLPG